MLRSIRKKTWLCPCVDCVPTFHSRGHVWLPTGWHREVRGCDCGSKRPLDYECEKTCLNEDGQWQMAPCRARSSSRDGPAACRLNVFYVFSVEGSVLYSTTHCPCDICEEERTGVPSMTLQSLFDGHYEDLATSSTIEEDLIPAQPLHTPPETKESFLVWQEDGTKHEADTTKHPTSLPRTSTSTRKKLSRLVRKLATKFVTRKVKYSEQPPEDTLEFLIQKPEPITGREVLEVLVGLGFTLPWLLLYGVFDLIEWLSAIPPPPSFVWILSGMILIIVVFGSSCIPASAW